MKKQSIKYPYKLSRLLTIHTPLKFKVGSEYSEPLVIQTGGGYYVGTLHMSDSSTKFASYTQWSIMFDDILDAMKYLAAVNASTPTCDTEDFLLASSITMH